MHLLLKKSAKNIANNNFFFWTYLSTLFLAFNYFFTTYINSTVLSQYITDKNIGILYTTGSLLTIAIFLNIGKILRRFGNYRTMLFFIFVKGVAILGMALFTRIPLILLAFIISNSLYPIIFMSLDTFMNHYARRENIGRIRGILLTTMNSAAIVSPMLVGLIIVHSNFRAVYLLSIVFIVSLFSIVRSKFSNYRDDLYETSGGINIITKFLRNKNIRQIFVTSLLLQIFYSWMIIYVPLYLLNYLHFTWPQVGVIIGISLIPFVVFEIPLGKLADERIGEKEILCIGFLVMIIAMIIVSFTKNDHVIFWISILGFSRIGASFVEIGSDTYFFKNITDTTHELVSFWRITTPLGYILGTLAGSLSLLLLPFQYIFFVLAIILIIGVLYSLKIRDTL